MKSMVAFLLASTIVGACTMVGCSSDPNANSSSGSGSSSSSTGNPEPTSIALADLGSNMANLFCDLAFSCCTPMEQNEFFKDLGTIPKSVEECIPVIKGQFDAFVVGGLQAGVDAGRLKYDGEAAKACLDAAHGMCATLMFDGPFDGASCELVFVGLVADGGDCAQSNECATSGSTCLKAPADMLGKCQPLPKEGEPCPGFECADGLTCGSVNMMDVCIKPLANGQACTSSLDCVSEYCEFNSSMCAPKKALGQTCSFSFECDNSYCEAQTNVCTALKAGGTACMSSEECASTDCSAGNLCTSNEPMCDGM